MQPSSLQKSKPPPTNISDLKLNYIWWLKLSTCTFDHAKIHLWVSECVCVCVCVWERERERERVCRMRSKQYIPVHKKPVVEYLHSAVITSSHFLNIKVVPNIELSLIRLKKPQQKFIFVLALWKKFGLSVQNNAPNKKIYNLQYFNFHLIISE